VNLSITQPIEYTYIALKKERSIVNVETFLGAKRKSSQTSMKSYNRLYDQDGCMTPKANQSFLINFNGIFDEQTPTHQQITPQLKQSGFMVCEEIWEKLKSGNF
jgi:hypothetical protein